MVFTSTVFLFAFFPLSLAAFYLVPPRWRVVPLLLTSSVFYAWGEPVLVVLILFVSGVIGGSDEPEEKSRASTTTTTGSGTKTTPAVAPADTTVVVLNGTTVTGQRPDLTRRTATEPTKRWPADSDAPTTTASAFRSSAAVTRPL